MQQRQDANFEGALCAADLEPIAKGTVSTLQVNMGKRCNQACSHCHVGAGPGRDEMMGREVAERLISLIESSPEIKVVDLTGGAPELNPNFPMLVERARALGRTVIDCCNLTVLTEPGMEQMAEFLAAHQVEIVASMPCYTMDNVDGQRGGGVFARSIEALKNLNQIGYGGLDNDLKLDLVYNPGGAFLPGPQTALEEAYKDQLGRGYDIRFNRLLTIVNMPICRFADQLAESGQQEEYFSLLRDSFNPLTVPSLMCRSYVSVSWDGALYDCDFNQMLDLHVSGEARTVFDIDSAGALENLPVATAAHCFGCTAGAGSSCQGALD